MRSLGLISFFALSISAPALARTPPAIPDPKQYPVETIFKGTPAVPILDTKHARYYQTRILEGAKAGPNFAGHYTVVSWGCGMASFDFVVIDTITGKVYSSPERCITYSIAYDLPIEDVLMGHPGFKLDSKLLLTIGLKDGDPANGEGKATMYLFDEGKFKVIYRVPAPFPRIDISDEPTKPIGH